VLPSWGSRDKPAMLTALEGYNLWSKSYHSEDNPIKKMSDDFISGALPALEGKSILDAGCGTGKFCVAATNQRASFAKGIDLSPAMIEEAKKNCPGGKFICADLSLVEIEKSFYDVVICGLVLGHIDVLEPVLKKLVEALKPGGHIILTDFHPYQTTMKAKRTFKDSKSGRTFEVKHTLHRLDEYFTLLKNSGIDIRQFKEPLFNGKPVIFGIHGVAV